MATLHKSRHEDHPGRQEVPFRTTGLYALEDTLEPAHRP